MTPRQRQLVKRSWRQVGDDAPRLAELFYSRLFEMAPPLRQLFQGDLKLQQQRLATMMDTLAADIDRVEELRPVLHDLGTRHARYGVTDAQYELFGDALMWAFQRVLWSDFTPDVEEAWRAAYRLMAEAMKAGAAAANAAVPEKAARRRPP
jgi:hemoglobin-like flavoprotein